MPIPIGETARVVWKNRRKLSLQRCRSGDGENHLDFDRSPARQFSGAHSHPSMSTGFSKDLNQKVRCPVENVRLLDKTFRRCHMPDHLHHTRNSVQRPKCLLGNRQYVQEREPRRLHSLLDRQIASELPGKYQLPVSHWEDTGQEQETADLYRRNIGRQRLRRRRQFQMQFLQFQFVRHPDNPCTSFIPYVSRLTHYPARSASRKLSPTGS